jgi:hypothetical protein
MHQFWHKKLPLSFHESWTTNRACNPNIALGNADNLYAQLCYFEKNAAVLLPEGRE